MASLRDLIAKKKQEQAVNVSSTKPVCLPLPSCSPGKRKVTISHVASPFEIYLIDLVNDLHKWQILTEFCENFRGQADQQANQTGPKVSSGDLVLIYDESIDTWLRGNVLKTGKNKLSEVFITDYGYTVKDVRISQCRSFPSNTPPELLIGSGLAVKFSLFHVTQACINSTAVEKLSEQLTEFSLENYNDVSETPIFTAEIYHFDSVSKTACGSLWGAEKSLLYSVFSSWKPKASFPCIPQDLVLGKPFRGTLTASDGPSSIFIHPHTDTQLNKLRTILAEIGKAVILMKEKVNTKLHFKIGQYVLAKYSDGNFYRAKVLESTGFDDYSVFFVDYGTLYGSKLKDIHPLPPSLANITPVGFKVKLSNVLSKSGNQCYGVFVDLFFTQLTSRYSKVESAFEFKLMGPCDQHGVYPCEINLVKPVDENDECTSLHEELGRMSCGALIDLSNSKNDEIYTKNDLYDYINFSEPQVALTYNILSASNSVTILLQSNLDSILNDLMEIKLSLMYKLKPFKSSYKPGDLVLFQNDDDGDEMPYNRGYVLKCEENCVLVHALELNSEFTFPIHRVVPYLKSFHLSAKSVYKAKSEEKLPAFSKSEKEVLVEVQFDPNGKKILDSDNETHYIMKNIRSIAT